MIYIVRHGQTDLNNRHVLQGRSDWPLNEAGREQVLQAAQMLQGISFSRVYTSPLIRAVETARIIAPGVTPVPDVRLIEMDYGRYDGLDLKALPEEVLTFFRDFVHNPAPETMEPLAEVVRRTGEFMEECCRSSENILIATHAIAMKGILEYLTPSSCGSYWSKYIGNCAVYVTEFQPDLGADGPADRPSGVFSVPTEMTVGSRKDWG